MKKLQETHILYWNLSLETLLEEAKTNQVLTNVDVLSEYGVQADHTLTIFLNYIKISNNHQEDRLFLESIAWLLTQYLDLYLQEYVCKLPRFLQDSDDLIRSLNTITWEKDLTLLTLDVKALYTNISHPLGIYYVQIYLEEDQEILKQQNFSPKSP